MDQISLALEQPVNSISQIAGDLVHPQPVCNGRDAGNLNAAGGQLNKEQNHETSQSLGSPNLDGEKIRCYDLLPVLGEELFPGCFPDSFRCCFDAVTFQDVGNRAGCQLMAEIRQRTLYS